MYCKNCGKEIEDNVSFCPNCGAKVERDTQYPQKGKSQIGAGLLGIFLGSLGIHNFYLGYMTKGIIQLLLTPHRLDALWIRTAHKRNLGIHRGNHDIHGENSRCRRKPS